MIFVTNAAGKAIYLGTEWTDLTGQTLEEAVDFGWVRVVHPEDRDLVRTIVAEAIRREEAFSVRYRLLGPDGRHVWVHGGAVPSFGPPERRFLGFLGSISQIPESAVPGRRAQGAIDSFAPPDPAAHRSRSSLEAAADHLIEAHALLGQGDEPLLAGLRTVLYQVGLKLAKEGNAPGSEGQVH